MIIIDLTKYDRLEQLQILSEVADIMASRLLLTFGNGTAYGSNFTEAVPTIANMPDDELLALAFECICKLRTTIEIQALLDRRSEILEQSNLTEEDDAELKELVKAIGATNFSYSNNQADLEALEIIRRAAQLMKV